METPLFAHVAVPRPTQQAFFDYRVPEEIRDQVQIGMRTLVPFGKQILTGYVVGLSESKSVKRIKDILDLPDAEPIFDSEMIELTRWVAEYYLCSWGEALECAAPRGLQQEGRHKFFPTGASLPQAAQVTPLQQQVLALLSEKPGLTAARVQKLVSARGIAHVLHRLEEMGLVQQELVISAAAVRPKKVRYARPLITREGAGPIFEKLAQRHAAAQARVLEYLLELDREIPLSALIRETHANDAAVKALQKLGWVAVEEREERRDPCADFAFTPHEKLNLNIDQDSARRAIEARLAEHEFGVFLLSGVTGSGKTEVYLHVIEKVLSEGGSAVVLVPEIALTPLAVSRFRTRLGDRVAVIHSGLGPGERYDEWRRLRRGEARVAVGARSAIFAPVSNLRLLVVDEEHDASYKQDDTPRYHARDVAVKRASLNNAVCILGSATPSLESYFNAQKGKYRLLELPSRATGQALPHVTLVDMRRESQARFSGVVLSDHLRYSVAECLQRGEQAMIFINRRGHSNFLLCMNCGHVPQCNHCSVSLTYHSATGHLHCHYCGEAQPRFHECPNCGVRKLQPMGTGTQKTETSLQNEFALGRVVRMDFDTTSHKGAHHKILAAFEKGEYNIMVGTQMISKGHDFPNLTLVGVINADASLHFPDFRSGERTFQLLTQVAGRAGRRDVRGEVVVQAYDKDHYTIAAASQQDYASFFSKELAYRKQKDYPPYRHFLRILIEGEDEKKVSTAAGWLGRRASALRNNKPFDSVEILGPSAAPVAKMKDRFRWHIALAAVNAGTLRALTKALLWGEDAKKFPSVKIKADMDALDWM